MKVEKNSQDPLIILIGGAAGTGKTTISNRLCGALDIPHRLGSGFVREVARSFLSKRKASVLHTYSFRPGENITPFQNLYEQSSLIKDGIELCIRRAYKEGTSIVIEGVNLIPGLIATKMVTLFVILYVENQKMHQKMLSGDTHKKRVISKEDFVAIRQIQNEFKRLALKHEIPVLYVGDVSSAVERLIEIINERRNP